MGTTVKLDGLDKLEKKLKANATLKDVKTVVKVNGGRLERQIKANTATAYTKGYSQQQTAGSVGMELLDGGLTCEAGVGMDYDPYLETGTRYMSPEPTVTPASKTVSARFFSDMEKLMK